MYPPLVWLFSAKQSYVKKDGRTMSILQRKNRINQLQKLIDPVFLLFLGIDPHEEPSNQPLTKAPQTKPSNCTLKKVAPQKL
jgi:hypothetical protein